MDPTQLLLSPTPSLVLAETSAFVLASWWKAIIFVAAFAAWAWFISTVADKHAARFYLPREKWNTIYMVTAIAAIAVIILNPLTGIVAFLVALPVVLLLLLVPPFVYVQMANKDERVPEEHHLTMNVKDWMEARKESREAKKADRLQLAIVKPDGVTMDPPEEGTSEMVVRAAAERLYIDGVAARAHKIELMPMGDKGYAVAHTIDGLRAVVGEPMQPQDAMRVIAFWQTASGLEAGQRRRQVGEPDVSKEGERHHLRVITSGGQQGLKLSLIVDPSKAVRRSPDQLGLLPQQFELLQRLVEDGTGVVLLAAPKGMGRTSMLYTVLKMHDAYTSNIQTIELEQQDTLEGIRQNIWSPAGSGPDHSSLLRSILRRDPSVVGVAEMLDEATAQEACKGDIEHARVYLSLPAEGALQAIEIFRRAVQDNQLAARSLKGVMAGKLVRALAKSSREAYVPSPDMLKKLGLSPEKVKTLYRHRTHVEVNKKVVPCPESGGTGFVGQIGVFEVYSIGDDEKSAIAQGDVNALATAMRKRGVPGIQQAALIRAVEGETSVDEVVRVTVGAQKSKPAAAKPKPAAAEA
ncbi:MAG: Flp pilus assembly complex ATPase component TadA [Phycisphaerales bacterium]|nr:Flp pilus assembly complex ATPase component TadA [Phycisphaerales bacterium]